MQDLRVEIDHRGERRAVVRGLSYQVRKGRTLAIVGESGSGKTLSCRALVSLLPPGAKASGSVRLRGEEILGLAERDMRRYRGAHIAMMFQNPARALNPTLRVGEQIAEAIRAHQKVNRATAERLGIELLQRMQLGAPETRYHAYPHDLSGGMQQRVTLAVALASKPALLIADEPTSALDVTTQAGILMQLRSLQRELGMALIIVSHDVRVATALADDLLVMCAGEQVEYGPAAAVLKSPVMPYTRALLAAVPSLGSRGAAPLPADSTAPVPLESA